MAELQSQLRKEMPDFKVSPKQASWFWRVIGFILKPFNKGFMTDYFTTLGRHVYTPSTLQDSDWGTIAHEAVHARDDLAHPVWFKLSYAFPQLLASLALFFAGAIWGTHWWLLSLLFLAALVLPSPGRVYWERRGYLMSMCCEVLAGDESSVTNDYYQQWMVDTYTDGSYLFMSWQKKKTLVRVKADAQKALAIVRGHLTLEPYSSTLKLIRASSGA